jgi:hypothetical protein
MLLVLGSWTLMLFVVPFVALWRLLTLMIQRIQDALILKVSICKLVLLMEGLFFCSPFVLVASNALWHWVDDQAPSYLLAMMLVWGRWPMMALAVITALVRWQTRDKK